MKLQDMSSTAVAEQLGNRLKQARLTRDVTQAEIAARTGLSRRAVINAEKGKIQLESLVAILQALGMAEQLNTFLPVQEISPLQLAKLKGRQRQRASGSGKKKPPRKEDEPAW